MPHSLSVIDYVIVQNMYCYVSTKDVLTLSDICVHIVGV